MTCILVFSFLVFFIFCEFSQVYVCACTPYCSNFVYVTKLESYNKNYYIIFSLLTYRNISPCCWIPFYKIIMDGIPSSQYAILYFITYLIINKLWTSCHNTIPCFAFYCLCHVPITTSPLTPLTDKFLNDFRTSLTVTISNTILASILVNSIYKMFFYQVLQFLDLLFFSDLVFHSLSNTHCHDHMIDLLPRTVTFL